MVTEKLSNRSEILQKHHLSSYYQNELLSLFCSSGNNIICELLTDAYENPIRFQTCAKLPFKLIIT